MCTSLDENAKITWMDSMEIKDHQISITLHRAIDELDIKRVFNIMPSEREDVMMAWSSTAHGQYAFPMLHGVKYRHSSSS